MSDKLLKALHETAEGLHQAGTMNAVTLRDFDAVCLPPIKDYSAAQIKRLRQRSKASQAVFAASLNAAHRPCRSGSRARSARTAHR